MRLTNRRRVARGVFLSQRRRATPTATNTYTSTYFRLWSARVHMPLNRPTALHDLVVPTSRPSFVDVRLATPAKAKAIKNEIDQPPVAAPAPQARKAKLLTPSPVRWQRSKKIWVRRDPTPPPKRTQPTTPVLTLTPTPSPPTTTWVRPPTPPKKAKEVGGRALPGESVFVPKGRAPSHLQQLRELKASAALKTVRDERIEALIDELAGDCPPLGRRPPFLPGPPSGLARRAAEDARIAADEARHAVSRIRHLCGVGSGSTRSARGRRGGAVAAAAAAAAGGVCAWELAEAASLGKGHAPVRAWECGY